MPLKKKSRWLHAMWVWWLADLHGRVPRGRVAPHNDYQPNIRCEIEVVASCCADTWYCIRFNGRGLNVSKRIKLVQVMYSTVTYYILVGNTCVPGLDTALAERLREDEDVITSFATGAWCCWCRHNRWRKSKAVVPARTTGA